VKVSVLVPSYNHARFLRRRLESILAQTYGDFEVLLLDDGSTDGSVAILEEYLAPPRVRLHASSTNSGVPATQWNRGVAMAAGDYVWIAESDDWADPRFLELLVPVLDRHPGVGLVHCPFQRVDEEDRVEDFGDIWWRDLDAERWRRDFVAPGREELKYLRRWNVISNVSGVVFRRRVFLDVGGADETYRLAADWQLWIKMLLVCDVGFVATPLNYWRWHSHSVRERSLRDGMEREEIRRVLEFLAERTGSPARRLLAEYYREKVASALRWRDVREACRHAPVLLGLEPASPRSWLLALRTAVRWLSPGRWARG
jgi:glycosyltransferase involved in cell wall biosynthesis